MIEQERVHRVYQMVVLGVAKSEAWGGLTEDESALWDELERERDAAPPGVVWWPVNEMPDLRLAGEES